MDLTIYTYGEMETMSNILNGIAMIFNSPAGLAIINCIAALTMILRILANLGKALPTVNIFKIAIGTVVIMQVLMMPTVPMKIQDNITGRFIRVDNLPIVFALPVGILENLGMNLAGTFEAVFRNVDYLPYIKYGTIFGVKLIDESRHWRTNSPVAGENFKQYFRQCIIGDVARNKYGWDALLNEDTNIWNTIKNNASTLRRVVVKNSSNNMVNVTCKEATIIIEQNLTSSVNKLIPKYANTIFGLAGNENGASANFFKNNIAHVFGYGGNQASAEDTLKQLMMINNLKEYVDSYGGVRNKQHLLESWKISGETSSSILPLLQVIIKGLLYASFIFVVPFIFTAKGLSKYGMYMTAIFSVQLWPSLFAIFNMFANSYSGSDFKAIAPNGVTFSTSDHLASRAREIESLASYMYGLIPLMSYTLVSGGVQGFVQLTAGLTSSIPQTASQIATETVTGNRTFDNVSVGNLSLENQSGYKTDFNSSYRSGSSEMQLADGTIMRNLGDGSTVFDNNQARSTGSNRISLQDSVQGVLSNNLSTAQSNSITANESFMESRGNTESQAANLLGTLASGSSSSKGSNYSQSGQHNQAVSNAVNLTNQVRDAFSIDTDTAAQISMQVSAGASLSKALSSFGLNLGGTAAGSESTGVKNMDSLYKAQDIANQMNNTDSYDSTIRGLIESGYNQHNSKDKSLSSGLSGSYEEMKRHEQQKNIADQDVLSAQQALTHSETQGVSSDREINTQVQEALVKSGYTSIEANRMIESGDTRIKPYIHSIAAKEAGGLIQQSKNLGRLEGVNKRISDNYTDGITIDPNISNEIEQKGKEVGLHEGRVKDNVSESSNAIIEKSENRFNDSLDQNNKVMSNMDDKIKNEREKSVIKQTGQKIMKQMPFVKDNKKK